MKRQECRQSKLVLQGIRRPRLELKVKLQELEKQKCRQPTLNLPGRRVPKMVVQTEVERPRLEPKLKLQGHKALVAPPGYRAGGSSARHPPHPSASFANGFYWSAILEKGPSKEPAFPARAAAEPWDECPLCCAPRCAGAHLLVHIRDVSEKHDTSALLMNFPAAAMASTPSLHFSLNLGGEYWPGPGLRGHVGGVAPNSFMANSHTNLEADEDLIPVSKGQSACRKRAPVAKAVAPPVCALPPPAKTTAATPRPMRMMAAALG